MLLTAYDIKNDIVQIKQLLDCASSSKLKQAYIRFTNKYKNRLRDETEQLIQLRTEEKCEYADLLSALLGMLEALLQEE